MVQIKGSAIKETIDQIKKRAGEEAFQKILGLLDEERIAAVHATYFHGVPIEVQLQGQGKAMIKYKGFQKHHRIMGFAIIGFFKKALEISGRKTWPSTSRHP
jgi:hypothetical protein